MSGKLSEVESRIGTVHQLEAVIADEYWPLPKYREMLFLS